MTLMSGGKKPHVFLMPARKPHIIVYVLMPMHPLHLIQLLVLTLHMRSQPTHKEPFLRLFCCVMILQFPLPFLIFTQGKLGRGHTPQEHDVAEIMLWSPFHCSLAFRIHSLCLPMGSFYHDDHIPTGIHFAAFLPSASVRRRCTWDETAFLDPIQVAKFQDALRTLPLPTWDVRVTDHCRLFEEQVVQLGQQFFGRKSKQRSRA